MHLHIRNQRKRLVLPISDEDGVKTKAFPPRCAVGDAPAHGAREDTDAMRIAVCDCTHEFCASLTLLVEGSGPKPCGALSRFGAQANPSPRFEQAKDSFAAQFIICVRRKRARKAGKRIDIQSGILDKKRHFEPRVCGFRAFLRHSNDAIRLDFLALGRRRNYIYPEGL